MQDTLPPNHILQNRYIIESVIGQGGFGITYKARHINLDKMICLKELYIKNINHRKADLSLTQTVSNFSFSSFLDRFVAEARKVAVFEHNNIVRVTDLFLDNGTAYIAMEYIEGETLKAKIAGKQLSDTEIQTIIHQLLNAVEEIHKKQLIHRDIKPENIMITPENRLVLIDFGTSKDLSADETVALGAASTVILTQGYAAPEQYSSMSPKGNYTDIYAIGATIYSLLTGAAPHSATDRNMGHEPDKLSPDHKYFELLMQAMAMKTNERFASVAEFRKAFNILIGNNYPGNITTAPTVIDTELSEDEKLVMKLEKFSNPLKNTTLFTNKPLILLGSENVKYIFGKNGELNISEKGIVSRGSWKLLTDTDILINDSKKELMLKPAFLDEKVLALKIDGREIILFVNENLLDDVKYKKYLRECYNNFYKVKTGILTSGKTLEIHNSEFSDNSIGKLATIDGEKPENGRYETVKNNVYVINDGIVENILFTEYYKLGNRDLKIISKIHKEIKVGDEAYIDGIIAPDGKYKLEWLTSIKVKNGKIINTSMF